MARLAAAQWRAWAAQEKARRCKTTGPVKPYAIRAELRTGHSLARIPNPSKRARFLWPGHPQPIRTPPQGECAKRKKARRAWHTPGQFMEEPNQSWPGEDQDSEIYARRMPRKGG
jgi:hypothetical protein